MFILHIIIKGMGSALKHLDIDGVYLGRALVSGTPEDFRSD